jgi:hypothetical protein
MAKRSPVLFSVKGFLPAATSVFASGAQPANPGNAGRLGPAGALLQPAAATVRRTSQNECHCAQSGGAAVYFNAQQVLFSFILDSPEERYRKLAAQHGDLLLRVPHHMIASYLGITPVSLSRIRKRMLEVMPFPNGLPLEMLLACPIWICYVLW